MNAGYGLGLERRTRFANALALSSARSLRETLGGIIASLEGGDPMSAEGPAWNAVTSMDDVYARITAASAFGAAPGIVRADGPHGKDAQDG